MQYERKILKKILVSYFWNKCATLLCAYQKHFSRNKRKSLKFIIRREINDDKMPMMRSHKVNIKFFTMHKVLLMLQESFPSELSLSPWNKFMSLQKLQPPRHHIISHDYENKKGVFEWRNIERRYGRFHIKINCSWFITYFSLT